ncbi:MAG: hypothetical protein U0941_21680 [Planctomycetaceae bacterium]
MIRFEIDSVESTDGGALICGRVHEGTVRVGSCFTDVKCSDSKTLNNKVNLRVIRIVAYGHSLDDLPDGMTGELKVSGEGIAQLSAGPYPLTVLGKGGDNE